MYVGSFNLIYYNRCSCKSKLNVSPTERKVFTPKFEPRILAIRKNFVCIYNIITIHDVMEFYVFLTVHR